jgi:hypothetical protein
MSSPIDPTSGANSAIDPTSAARSAGHVSHGLSAGGTDGSGGGIDEVTIILQLEQLAAMLAQTNDPAVSTTTNQGDSASGGTTGQAAATQVNQIN